MFQRLRGELKGAFDTIAEEQTRQRAQQAPSTTGRRSNSQTRQRQTRPKPSNADLVGPDPDPAQFVVGDDTPASTPDPSVVRGPILETIRTDRRSREDETQVPLAPGVPQQMDGASETASDMQAETQAKLRRLSKLEAKYQDLLKAYRRAHTRNSSIEPFEARLREATPLTSINDPTAFVEYITQLSTKGDMMMNELKKVSADNDTLRQKLDEAEKQTRDAHDELVQLRKEPKEAMNSPPPSSDTTFTANSVSSPPGTPPSSLSLGNLSLSPKSRTTRFEQESNEDMFSVEDEVPKLHFELQQRNERIEKLEASSVTLRSDLASARESTEQMMHNLENAQQDLESVESSSSKKEKAQQSEVVSLLGKVSQLGGQLSKAQMELQKAEKSIAEMTELRTENLSKIGALEKHVKMLEQQESALQDRIRDLTQNKDQLTSDHGEARGEATDHGEARGEATDLEVGAEHHVEDDAAASKKKKNKKKKKKGGINQAAEEESSQPAVPVSSLESTHRTPQVGNKVSAVDFEALLKQKDGAIDNLNAKLKSQDDLAEEIETLRDELLHIGQEHVEAKKRIKDLEAERKELQKHIGELQEQADEYVTAKHAHSELESKAKEATAKAEALEVEKASLLSRLSSLESSSGARDDLTKSFEELQLTSKTLETDLSAAQSLAASRFKEMASLRDLLQKAQPELTSLRTEVSELKTSRDDLATKNREFRKLELREESLRSEIEALKRDATSKDSELKSLSQKVSQETTSRIAAEETNRRAQRDLQRATSEREAVTASRDTASTELYQTRSQLDESRTRLQQVQRQVEQLTADTDTLRDEISLKTAQHASAESLMSSVRDQAAEMAMQMREVQERCESLEEELQDAHRLMSERGREGETMRRLLGEVEGRAESRVKEMRERMEIAVQERDRAEDEAASVGRRRTREVEEVKSRLRDVEREVRRAKEDKEDIEKVERDLRRQKDDGDRRVEQSSRELEEVRRAMSELRDALDDGEKQIRAFEEERNELKGALDEAQGKLEKLQKSNRTLTEDLRNLRATRIRPTDSPSQSSRSSFDSNRRITSPSPAPPSANLSRGLSHSGLTGPTVDYVYLKNVLLQFLEQKDKTHQMQLVPVLSMLLKFDKKDEQKWTAAIAAK